MSAIQPSSYSQIFGSIRNLHKAVHESQHKIEIRRRHKTLSLANEQWTRSSAESSLNLFLLDKKTILRFELVTNWK